MKSATAQLLAIQVAGLAGFGAFCRGLWLWSHALALTVAGAVVVAWAVLQTHRRSAG